MTTQRKDEHEERSDSFPISRRNVLKSSAVATGAIAFGGAGLASMTDVANAIEVCNKKLDIVLAFDYSGSITKAGTWDDLRDGITDFIDALAGDNQIGLVTFGDAPKAYDFGSQDYLIPAEDGGGDNRPDVKSAIPTDEPAGENSTHMAGAIDLANEILDEQGRGGSEVILLLTDGGPNYIPGIVGDGSAPPQDDDICGPDVAASGLGPGVWKPCSVDDSTIPFSPGGSQFTFDYQSDGDGTEDADITQDERDETAARATAAKSTNSTGSGNTRLITVAVGAGGENNTFLKDRVASTQSDHLELDDPTNLGEELTEILEELCVTVCEVDLIAAQDEDVGSVFLSLEDSTLTVTYDTAPGYYLAETHLQVGDDCGDLEEVTRGGQNNPVPGQFEYSRMFGYDGDVTTTSFEIDTDEFDDEDGVWYIAAHAVVYQLNEDDEVIWEETAWGEGCYFNGGTERGRGGNWAMYIEYDPENNECGCIDAADCFTNGNG